MLQCRWRWVKKQQKPCRLFFYIHLSRRLAASFRLEPSRSSSDGWHRSVIDEGALPLRKIKWMTCIFVGCISVIQMESIINQKKKCHTLCDHPLCFLEPLPKDLLFYDLLFIEFLFVVCFLANFLAKIIEEIHASSSAAASKLLLFETLY